MSTDESFSSVPTPKAIGSFVDGIVSLNLLFASLLCILKREICPLQRSWLSRRLHCSVCEPVALLRLLRSSVGPVFDAGVSIRLLARGPDLA